MPSPEFSSDSRYLGILLDVSKEPNVIRIIEASQNNLKKVSLDIPVNALTVITGVSGSGKSSLAFDTLYAEGQRRYVESLSAYARQFLERINKPAVKEIQGICPSIAIRQKNTARNPRSTVGTVTEIYDFMRLLFARIGRVVCHGCGREIRKDTVDEVVSSLLEKEGARALITFPFAGSVLDFSSDQSTPGVSFREVIDNLVKQGFIRLIRPPIDSSPIFRIPEQLPDDLEDLRRCHVLVDRLRIAPESSDRLADSLELCFAEGNGLAEVTIIPDPPECPRSLRFSEKFECTNCGIRFTEPEPRLFSFNNPYGACPTCQGFGNTMSLDPDRIIPDPERTLEEGPVDPFNKPRYRRYQRKLLDYALQAGIPTDVPFRSLPEFVQRKIWDGDSSFPGIRGFFDYLSSKKYKMHVRIFMSRYRGYSRCFDCGGERLRREAQDVYVGGRRIGQLSRIPVSETYRFFSELKLSESDAEIGSRLLREIIKRLEFLRKVGLDYLTLDRLSSTLSGGEVQRIHLAASLGSSLSGTLYVLDEPSIGLHPRDQERLVQILKELRDLDNTMVVVEHEREIMRSADRIIDIGPGPGELGGEIVFNGDLQSLLEEPKSITGGYLRGDLKIPVPVIRRKCRKNRLVVRGARKHNLKSITVEIPLQALVCITGVSGSGKSTLVDDVIYPALKGLLGGTGYPTGAVDAIEGWEMVSEVLMVDQSPIGRTPRSNPVTYIKAFDEVRRIFAGLREAHARNLSPGHFSFNIPGGRCEACLGSGVQTVEMQFLADVELQCEECKGTRYQKQVLEVRYKGKNIHDVLNLTVQEAIGFFSGSRSLERKLKVLREVGLGYLRLGQSATTLSGGEAQRIKLASYLAKNTSGRPLFIFDEPTTGLHFDDIGKLLRAFDRLMSRGASLIVIEHNLDVIKCADWIIDLGLEGGDAGGEVVCAGPPEKIADCERSFTGRFLKDLLDRSD